MIEEITWTKEYKLERYHKLNLTAEKGCVLFAGSSLMEMFPVEKFAHEDGLPVTVYNRGVGGFLSDASRSMEQIMSNYALILDKVKKAVPEVRMYLMAYYPVNYSAATPEMKPCLLIRSNEKIARANEEVKMLADRFGASYIDVTAPLKDEDGDLRAEYTIEGMHINEDGYRSIYPLIRKYILE